MFADEGHGPDGFAVLADCFTGTGPRPTTAAGSEVVPQAPRYWRSAGCSKYWWPGGSRGARAAIEFVDQPDLAAADSLGARGFGETPMTGVTAAIANAIHHATGRRIRDLPITQDALLL